MEIISPAQIEEWLRIDPNTDAASLDMLVSSAIDIIEHETGRYLRPYTVPVTMQEVVPPVPRALQHAIAVFVSAHFDDRAGSADDAMRTLKRLCAPFKVYSL